MSHLHSLALPQGKCACGAIPLWQSPNGLETLYNCLKMAAVKVPTIDKRKRIPQKAIDRVVEQIVEKFKPQKIILFGSYARGDYRPESDVDLLVVMDTPLKESKQSLEIRRHLDVMFGLDLIVHTPKRLKERLDMGDWFLRDVLKEGKVLYESSSR
jgi:predicted nucleotidyltransferase